MTASTRLDRAGDRPRLAATIAPLVATGSLPGLREALAWASAAGYPEVQLSVVDSELKPREFGASARRDLAATLSRLELACSGIDMFLPPAHLADPTLVSRAVDAVVAAIEFAADLGRAPVTVPIAADAPSEVASALAAAAERAGVELLLPTLRVEDAVRLVSPQFASIDCAAVLGAGGAPDQLVLALGRKVGGIRLVDLLRSGLRGPILEPRESRLDALALRVALDAAGFQRAPVIDARQWTNPRRGLEASLARWSALAGAV